VFKYAAFAASVLHSYLEVLGVDLSLPAWHVLLPLGISFHTLQTIGYSIDVYRGVREPERNLGIFALYVSFFPQMVAGPIERSTTLLPQLRQSYEFRYNRVVSGLRLMMWGMFKKLVIADRMAVFVNTVYAQPSTYGAISTLLATYLFAFQIYCDFSGYTDIARGAARVLGYELTINFALPYFATSIREFWHRWHVSLSSWFRDYVYIPLGGRTGDSAQRYANVFAVFLISGLWHGANWTFIVWGLLHGFYYVFGDITLSLREKMLGRVGLSTSRAWKVVRCVLTFQLTAFAWILFRARSLTDATQLVKNLSKTKLEDFLLELHRPGSLGLRGLAANCALICLLLAIEWLTRQGSIEDYWAVQPVRWRWSIAYTMLLSILMLGTLAQNEFLYFQF
jgi:D-alanyl-lipoteichoic acid acyltransferase DltB (MBOAT superfamily)